MKIGFIQIGFLFLALVGLGPASVRAQLAVFDPTFSGTARSDLDLGSHTIVGGSWNGPSQLVQLDASGRLPVADGSRLTHLDASNLVSGTVADALLGGNIPRLNATNTWSADQMFSGVVAGVHLAGAGSTPSIATSNGAGIPGTASVTGTDLAGTITVNIGAAPLPTATIVTLTFAAPFTTAPHPVLSAGNPAAAALWGPSSIYTTTTTTALTLKSNSSAVAPSTQYVWHYHLAQ